jgi:hypothetical protein
MSDFLGRLAARAIGREPSIRPDLAPVTLSLASPQGEDGSGAARGPTPLVPGARAGGETGGGRIGPVEARSGPGMAGPRLAPNATGTAGKGGPEVRDASTDARRTPAAANGSDLAELGVARAAPGTPRPRPSDGLRDGDGPKGVQLVPVDRELTPSVERAGLRDGRAAGATPAVAGSVRPQSQPTIESSAGRMGADRGPRGARPESDAIDVPRTVLVTIGRVEVRAAFPAVERPRQAASQAPRLSIDDYLAERRAGTR